MCNKKFFFSSDEPSNEFKKTTTSTKSSKHDVEEDDSEESNEEAEVIHRPNVSKKPAAKTPPAKPSKQQQLEAPVFDMKPRSREVLEGMNRRLHDLLCFFFFVLRFKMFQE